MKLAFYKYSAQSAWYKTLHHRLVCWWTRGPYSHVEMVLAENPDGTSVCASSSARDGGIRIKSIDLRNEKWDFLDIQFDSVEIEQWFKAREGAKYDYLAWLGFLWRRETGSKNKWFCSEACLTAAGYANAWRFDPNSMYDFLVRFAR